jgi:hypothetical protein
VIEHPVPLGPYFQFLISQANDPTVLYAKQYNLCLGSRVQTPSIQASVQGPFPGPSKLPHEQTLITSQIIENTTSAPNTEASSSTETPIPASITKKAREVARYAQKHGHGHDHHGKEGLLVIDSGEIEELVGVLTLCAMLEVSSKEKLGKGALR